MLILNAMLYMNVFFGVLLFGGLIFVLVLLIKKITPKKIGPLKTAARSGNYKEAIRLAKEILQKDPNNIEAHFFLAEAYYNQGKFELALIEYKSADKIGVYTKDINELDLRKKLAELYSRFDNYEESLKEYILLIKKYPNDHILYFNCGEMFQKKGMKEQAYTYYAKSVSLNNRHVPCLINLGILCFEFKKFGESATYLETAVKIDPDNYQAYFYLGLLKKNDKDLKAALKFFENASRGKDYKVKSLMERGVCLILQSKYEDAVIELERALKNADNESQNVVLNIRFVLAQCYETTRNITEAIEQWEKIYSVKPDFKNVSEKLANYQDLRMDDKMKDFMTATNEDFLDISKNIVEKHLNLNITDTKVISSEDIQFYTMEGSDSFRNVKKKPVLVQISRRSSPVDEITLRKLHELMKENNIIKGMVLCSSTFTKLALSFTQERPIELIDKDKLQALFNKIN